MQAAYESFGCNQGNVFFLGIDKGNTNAAVMQFDSIYGIHYPSASGNQGNGNTVHWDYNIQATPSIVVIKPDKSIAVKQIFPPATQNVVDSVSMVGGILQECLTATEELKSSELTLFPNPVRDFLTITLNGNLVIESIQIYDLTGQQIKELPYFQKLGSKWTMGTADLPSGFYFIEVLSKGGKRQVHKFIKR